MAEKEYVVLDIPISENESQPPQEDNDSQIESVPSNFFTEIGTPHKPKHHNLTPDLEHSEYIYPNNDLGLYTNDKNIDTMQVLAADHPLLNRFQESLKAQLNRRINLIRRDVTEIEENCRNRIKERESAGLEAYETQQTCNKQRDLIEESLKELETIISAREEIEYQLDHASEKHVVEKNALAEVENEELQVRAELDSIDGLLSQMRSWEEELESEMLVNKRILDNTEKFKAKLHAKKKHQDAIIFNIMSEVWKLEIELETTLMQLRVKEEDRERLAESVALGNIDVEASQAEHRCLMQGWQSVLATISQRDKYNSALLEEFKKHDDRLSGVNCELLYIKKEINREHFENERLTFLKDRIETDTKNMAHIAGKEIDKANQLMKIASQYDKFIEENNKQHDTLSEESQLIVDKMEAIENEVEKRNQARFDMERDIINHVQQNAFNTDACRQMANILKDFKEDNRRKRINIARVEGIISNKHAEWQNRRLENTELMLALRDLTRIVNTEDNELEAIHCEYANCDKELSKLICHYEALKLKTVGDAAQKLEMWPQEVRIRQLEATISDLIDHNKESQSFWLREQAIVVDLSERRQDQIQEMDLLKKQVSIVDQKNFRINDSLAKLTKAEELLNRNITALENKLYVTTSNLNKKKDCKMAIDVANNKILTNLVSKLEESEFATLKLKAEIVEAEEDKMSLSKELIEKNRESMAWEGQLQLVKDARKQMADSQSENGEICQMKTEIHRMQVRHVHLRKVQEKLIHDLENCVFRRDAMVTLAEARSRSHKGGTQQWRINFNKRRDDLRANVQSIKDDLQYIARKMVEANSEIVHLHKDITIMNVKVAKRTEECAEANRRHAKAKINRQFNLDVLLLKQRKLKMYLELSRGREPFVYFKTPTIAHTAYTREHDINSKLRRIIECAQTDTPQLMTDLTKMHNSLLLPALHM